MRAFQRVLHPIDLEHRSAEAFCHALMLALCATGYPHPKDSALLELFHCETDKPVSFSDFPKVRQRLIRWGVLPDGAEKQAVVDLGLSIRKQLSHGEVLEEIALETEASEFDLLVMSSQARAGTTYFLHPSTSASAVQNTQIPGLIFPLEAQGFVHTNTGSISLNRILVPITHEPDGWPALQAVARLLLTLNSGQPGEAMLTYVGRDQEFPEYSLPTLPDGWHWTRKTLAGEPVAALGAWAQQWEPQLTAVSSAGQKSWKDRWFGSTAEHLLSQLHCPMLVAPCDQL